MRKSSILGSLLSEIGNIESLQQALVLYQRLGIGTKAVSPRTRQEYENDLADLIAFLAFMDVTKLNQVGLAHLRLYQADLEKRGYKASTRNRRCYALKDFTAFLYEYALINTDIAKELIPPPVERGEPRFLTEAEYTRLLQTCSGNIRDTAIIQLFLQIGIRLSELVGMSINDVFLSQDTYSRSTIRIRRGGGHATIPLNDKARNALKQWLAIRESIQDAALFLTALKKPMGKRGVQLMLEKYLREIGIQDASVQSLRHTMAVHHLAKGTPLTSLAEILGDSPDSMQVYLSAARKLHSKALQENAL